MPNILFDTSTGDSIVGGGASSITWSHTNAGNMLIVSVRYAVASTTTITATYNGVSMTQLAKYKHPNAGDQHIATFVLLNPSLGANDVVVTLGLVNLNLTVRSASYFNVDGYRSVFTDTDAGGFADVTVTDAISGDWIISAITGESGTLSEAHGETIRGVEIGNQRAGIMDVLATGGSQDTGLDSGTKTSIDAIAFFPEKEAGIILTLVL